MTSLLTAKAANPPGVQDRGIGVHQQLDLYRTMRTARTIDEVELELVRSGEAFFHVPCTGHESAAVLNAFLLPEDWLHCHYRDKALMLARGIPPEMFFHSLLCTVASHSLGRQMSAHISDPGRRVLSLVGPVGNNALQSVGIAAQVTGHPARPIVLCSMGDGASQQGEVLEAIAEAVRSHLPVLFFIEDNRFSISTTTAGKTFYDLPGRRPEEFYGLPIHRLDGRDAVACYEPLGRVVAEMRASRGPAIVAFAVERLSNHTNADDERTYRSAEEIAAARATGDPLERLAIKLLEAGTPQSALDSINGEVSLLVRRAADFARHAPDPAPKFDAKAGLPAELDSEANEHRGSTDEPRYTMLEALREVLHRRMEKDERISLCGEDIEDPKGDVFGVTRGLTRAFPGRVLNSALSESTIVGTAIGRALAGGRPVAFIQFADFLPLAFNQIIAELGSMHWRTNGGWRCPVIVMAACGGYRPGLGPFHAQTLESVMAHVPGVDVFMPSSAGDAAGLLNAAFDSDRPTIFLYPKVCLNDRQRTTSLDVYRQRVPIGKARRIAQGDDLSLVAWGSTVPICEQVAATLARAGVGVDLIDLRSISPWDSRLVAESASRTGRLLIVHEDNVTCGFGAEVAATIAEQVQRRVSVRRVARPDTYIPCNFPNQLDILPSFRGTLVAASEMLGLEVSWKAPADQEGDLFVVEVIGSSPADQALTVVRWLVEPGDRVEAAQSIVEAEGDKAVFEISSPVSGAVERLMVQVGERVAIGQPLAHLRTDSINGARKRASREDPGVPTLKSRGTTTASPRSEESTKRITEVGLSAVHVVTGSELRTNEDLCRNFAGRTSDDILARCGIESRPLVGASEDALTMAVAAATEALDRERLTVKDLSAVICSTTTPLGTTPSMACRILAALCRDGPAHEVPAFDINAACSGYLYALGSAYDWIQSAQSSRVLVVTTEAMSRIVDEHDFDTAIIFGDAATATLVYGPDDWARTTFRMRRPVLSAKAEDGKILSVPNPGCGFVHMDGKKVFAEAVRKMAQVLGRACEDASLSVADLRLIIPHQANARIIDAIRDRMALPADRVFTNIRHLGNTSSSSIPICLRDVRESVWTGDRLGLCAFGGGFTFAAAVLETR